MFVAWIALVVAVATLAWQITSFVLNRRDQGRRNIKAGEHDRAIRELQGNQAAAIAEIAKVAASTTLEGRHKQGAQISARFEPTETHGTYRLVIRNTGPGGAHLRKVDIPTEPDILYEPDTGMPIDLLPNEEHTIYVMASGSTPVVLEVVVSWLDATGEHGRAQTLATP